MYQNTVKVHSTVGGDQWQQSWKLYQCSSVFVNENVWLNCNNLRGWW